MGGVFALLALVGLLLCSESIPLAIVISAGIAAAGLFRLEPSEEGKFTPQWNTIFCYLTPILGAIFLVFLTQWAMHSRVTLLSIDKLLLEIGIGLCVILVFLILTGRVILSCALGMGGVMMLTTADWYVYSFRGTEFLPSDLLSLGTAMNVAGGYDYTPGVTLVRAWALLVLFLMLASIIRYRPFKLLHRAIILLPILAVSAGAVLFGMRGHVSQQWQLQGVNNNGFMLNFAIEVRDSVIREPENYDVDALEALAQEYPEDEKEPGPTVIVIMDESFADFRVMGENFQTNEPVMPFLDTLQENTIRGFATSSVYGGGTANSEYEFLTGNSLAFLPQGCICYQQYVHGPVCSFVSDMKERGYYCLAMHPYYESGWMRNTVWPGMGFDECLFLDDFPRENLVRSFVSDQEMFEMITSRYEQRDPEQPLFIWGVTMQNHGGYTYGGSDFEPTIALEGLQGSYPTAEQYLSVTHETDKALEYLIGYFSQVQEPVVIAFYGDHLPKLPDEFYEEIHGGPFETLAERQERYTIPFFVWANYDIPEQQIPLTSINYLSNFVYQASGMSMPAYNQLLAHFQEKIPALNSQGYYSLEQGDFIEFDAAEGEEKELLNQYWQLQYNNMFDTSNPISIFRVPDVLLPDQKPAQTPPGTSPTPTP